MPDHNQTAPGALEDVRKFINTWSIDNATREAVDGLPHLLRTPLMWRQEFPRQALARTDTLARLERLRSDLRGTFQQKQGSEEALNNWFSMAAINVKTQRVGGDTKLLIESSEKGFIGYIVAVVANAIASADWSRLKTCPDCQWAFYDHTRNASKRWCGMTKGGPDGRACGTIAKVSAYRTRQATKAGNL